MSVRHIPSISLSPSVILLTCPWTNSMICSLSTTCPRINSPCAVTLDVGERTRWQTAISKGHENIRAFLLGSGKKLPKTKNWSDQAAGRWRHSNTLSQNRNGCRTWEAAITEETVGRSGQKVAWFCSESECLKNIFRESRLSLLYWVLYFLGVGPWPKLVATSNGS